MTKFVPIYPLSAVIYPGEILNLHVTVPKYEQLVHECYNNKKEFCLAVTINNELQEYGTIMLANKIVNEFENGDLDIKAIGQSVCRILEHIHNVPDKLYKGAIVHYIENEDNGRATLMDKVITSTRLFHHSLNVYRDFKKDEKDLRAYDIAHFVGLSIAEEYELLTFREELHRQEYLRRHLAKKTPGLSQIEEIKERINMNGHFRWLK